MKINSFIFRKEPFWFYSSEKCFIPPSILSWLKTSGSLTIRLRENFSDVEVNVLFEKMERPFLKEKYDLNTHSECLIREIILFSHTKQLVLARSIIPSSTLRIANQLAFLKNKPLGEVLFSNPTLTKTTTHFCRTRFYDFSESLKKTIPISHTSLWGRKTLYTIYNQPLIVNEFFLPTIYD